MSGKIKNIFIWNNDFCGINSLFETVIGGSAFKKLKEIPPKYYLPEDLNWLAREIGSNHIEARKKLIEAFAGNFNYVRMYHACCPLSVNSYYKNGFKLLNMKEQESHIRGIFKDLESEYIDNAIKAARSYIMKDYINRRKRICFSLDREFVDAKYGEFMLGGSEYLRGIAAHLENDQMDKWEMILCGRVPTVFVVDVPVGLIEDEYLFSIIGNIACKWVTVALYDKTYEASEITVCLGEKIPAKYISSHYHLEKIICSNTAEKVLDNIHCDQCFFAKNISYTLPY
jgi:hypothetical protein